MTFRLDRSLPAGLLAAALSLLLCRPLPSDEGMWLFNRLPLDALREKHRFTPPPGWEERIMRSAVRLSSGGSGSFVSPEGLVLTNHHVGSDALQKLSTPERNLLRDGFLARSPAEELRCPDLEVISLVEIEDVTARVNAAVPAGATPAASLKARREASAVIEKESKDRTGLQSQVVTLYQGGEYHLYRYRRHDDVRLVMAPEVDIAFFGGDVDNFEFPRFDLDMCFFRVYVDGKPLRTEAYLPFEPAGARDGDLVFVAGHPGRTQRLLTVDHLRFLRDVEHPSTISRLAEKEVTLQQFSLRGQEAARIARDELFTVQNSRKAYRGMIAGLLDPATLAEKQRAETALRARAASGEAKASGGGAGDGADHWARIAQGRQAYREFYEEYQLLEGARAFWSTFFERARGLVRLAEEKEKPNAERLPGYRESDMESLELELYSPAPVYPELEQAQLADSLTHLAGRLGAEHPLSRMVLAGKGPVERAAELVSGTRLGEVAFRKELAAGGSKAIREAADPMVALARMVDPYARAVRRKFEDLVQGVEREAYAGISRARSAAGTAGVYPDATFTLRLAFGLVKGTEEQGRRIPPFTTLGGAFERSREHEGKDPFRLPPSWLAARDGLDLSTPFNFTCTADIIGGNSGSPVVNRDGRLVGLIFDGNIHSLVLDFTYTEEKARAISVASQAILEALRKVYRAQGLAAELAGKAS